MMSIDASPVVSAQTRCPACGQPVPEDAPGGLCPGCLLGLVSADEPGDAPPSEPEVGGLLEGRQLFGDHELLEEIARGGMGVVYKARQVSLNRIVALKMILAGRFASKKFVQRFKAEAATAAILQHPNIVAVHEVGVHQGQHFFSMDYVEGQNLAQVVGTRPLLAGSAARYVKLIAQAVGYAHGRGVFHRDLKPSNILIDQNDQPRVTDFGLAKRLDTEMSLTLTGQMLGSPNFMPPEQVSASGQASPQSDVYGLGAILYYLLTARAPFQGETMEAVVNQVAHAEVVAPRLLNASVPRDLETICLKCLEKEPRRRYPTAQAVADDLERFLQREPISARPVGPLGRAWRWCRRRPGLTTALVLLHVVFALGLAGILWQWRQAVAGRLATSQYLYDADMLLAQQAIEASNLGRATALLYKHRPAGRAIRSARPSPDLRGWEWYYCQGLCASDELGTLGVHSNGITALAYSGSGAFLASGDLEGEVRLWDTKAGQLLVAWPGSGEEITGLSFSPDEQFLAAGGRDERVRVYDLTTRQLSLPPLVHSSPVFALAFTADSGRLKTCSGTELVVWRLKDGRRLSQSEFDGRFPSVFGPGNDTIAVALPQGKIRLYHSDTTHAAVLTGHTNRVQALRYSLDSKILYSASLDGSARAWNVGGEAEVGQFVGHKLNVTAVAASPNGNLLATGSSDQTIRLWDTATYQQLGLLRGQNSPVRQLAFAPDGRTLASGGGDGQLKIWPAEPKPTRRVQLAFPGFVSGWHLAPDGSALDLLDPHGAVIGVDLRSMVLLEPQPFPAKDGRSCPIQPGGRLRALDEGGGFVGFWDRASGARVGQISGALASVYAIHFSLDGQLLAIAARERDLQLWHVPTRRLVRSLVGHTNRISAHLRFSADATKLAAAYQDGRVALWNLARPGAPAIWRAHGMFVTATAFAPDGRTIVTGSVTGVVKVWETSTQREIARLSPSVLPVLSLALSPDGRRLAAGTQDGVVTLYDVVTFQPIAQFTGHADPDILDLAFTSDGTALVEVSMKDVIVRHASLVDPPDSQSARK